MEFNSQEFDKIFDKHLKNNTLGKLDSDDTGLSDYLGYIDKKT